MCRTAWCGVSGRNGILEALRVANGPFLSLSLFSFLLFSTGVLFYHLFLVSPFLCWLIIVPWFLDVFAFFVHFLCTGLSFNKVFMLLIKKRSPLHMFLSLSATFWIPSLDYFLWTYWSLLEWKLLDYCLLNYNIIKNKKFSHLWKNCLFFYFFLFSFVEPLTLVMEGLSNFEACLVNEPSSSKGIYL